MLNGHYQLSNQVLKFKIGKDSGKIIFNHYIMQKENLERLNGELKRGQFKLSARTVAKDLDLPLTKVHRLIKEFEKLGIISPVSKSKTKHEASIYCYLASQIKPKSETVNETVNETVKHDNINTLSGVGETVNETVNETSKKELLKRVNKKVCNIDTHAISRDVINHLNDKLNKNYKFATHTEKISRLLDDGYTKDEIVKAIDHAILKFKDDKPNLLNPNFILRADNIDEFLNYEVVNQVQQQGQQFEEEFSKLTDEQREGWGL